jgi:hypothetical protein
MLSHLRPAKMAAHHHCCFVSLVSWHLQLALYNGERVVVCLCLPLQVQKARIDMENMFALHYPMYTVACSQIAA